MRSTSLLVLFFFFSVPVPGQQASSKQIRKLADRHFLEGIETLRTFLEIPNFGGDPEQIEANLEWCRTVFTSLDFETKVLISDGVKHLLAERVFGKRLHTMLFYLQIDGQPVDSSRWNQESPFIPTLKDCGDDDCLTIDWHQLADYDPDWKVFARSASDSKGPAVALIQALRALHEIGQKPAFNLKIIMDFQEELGSPTLPKLVEENRTQFEAEAMLIMDGTRPPGNLPTLMFGARGIATMKLTVFGARRNLHSGQYGNYAPNPVFGLSRLLAAMKDENGQVLIPGYYDGVVMDEETRKIVNSVPEGRETLLRNLGISVPEQPGSTYQESLQYPSLNVRGLRAGWVENEVRTIIPSEALAEIDMRLVPETPAERQIQLMTDFIRSKGYHIIDHDPTDEERAQYSKLIRIDYRVGSRPFRTPLESELGNWLGEAMTHVFGQGNFISMQSTGGSQPIAPFITTLGIPAISVRIPNPDNSIHAPNENLRLGNFHEGLMMCLAILTQDYDGE